jgi:SAM-dependent methyltransferase
MDFPEGFFDAVYAVSTLEHMGLAGRYGIQKNDLRADYKAMLEIKRILKPTGTLLVTVPYGHPKLVKSMERIYDKTAVIELIHGWTLSTIQYYMISKIEKAWYLVPENMAAQADNVTDYAMALVEVLRQGNSSIQLGK